VAWSGNVVVSVRFSANVLCCGLCCGQAIRPWALALITLIFLGLLVWKGHGGSQGKDREVDFYKSAIVPSTKLDKKKV
jgi:hypothetical protein